MKIGNVCVPLLLIFVSLVSFAAFESIPITPAPKICDGDVSSLWNWGNGVSLPDPANSNKFYDRTIDLIDLFRPGVIHFDDRALPLWSVSDAVFQIAAHFYKTRGKMPVDNGAFLYAIVPGRPTNGVNIAALGKSTKLPNRPINKILFLGSAEKIQWVQGDKMFMISLPKMQLDGIGPLFKITPQI